MKQPTSKTAWLTLALSQLIEKGPQALTIEQLCDLKGVTKGSFYHHFSNRAVFVDELMSHWYQSMTLNFIEQANSAEGALARLQKLDSIIAAADIEAEMHIRAWALKEPNINKHIEKIDQQRQTYLQSCYEELGADKSTAADIATITYAQFLGLQQIRPKLSNETMLSLSAMLAKQFFNIDDKEM